jgi:hypothetical protein
MAANRTSLASGGGNLRKSTEVAECVRVIVIGGYRYLIRIDLEVAIVEGYPIEGGFAIDFFLCIFT